MSMQKHKQSAFTLVETVTALACGTLVLAALLAASVALQRSFAAVEGYSIAEGDELRVQDYIAMDCRRATGGTLGALTTPAVDNGSWVSGNWVHNSSGTTTLILLVPNYYDSNGNAQAPYFVTGKIQYGNAGTTPISYYQSGSNFMRQVGTDPTQAKAIATNVSTFNVTPVDQSNNKVSCSITFKPTFTTLPGPGPIAGTTVYSQTFLRNAVARQ